MLINAAAAAAVLTAEGDHWLKDLALLATVVGYRCPWATATANNQSLISLLPGYVSYLHR